MMSIYEKINHAVLSMPLIREYWIDKDFDWEDFNPNLIDTNFLREFKDEINWSFVSEFRSFTSQEVEEFKDKINWRKLSCYQNIAPDILKKYDERWNYDMLGTCQKLPEDFVWKHRYEVNWRTMTTHQNFSKEFWAKVLDAGLIPSPWVRDTIRQRFL